MIFGHWATWYFQDVFSRASVGDSQADTVRIEVDSIGSLECFSKVGRVVGDRAGSGKNKKGNSGFSVGPMPMNSSCVGMASGEVCVSEARGCVL